MFSASCSNGVTPRSTVQTGRSRSPPRQTQADGRRSEPPPQPSWKWPCPKARPSRPETTAPRSSSTRWRRTQTTQGRTGRRPRPSVPGRLAPPEPAPAAASLERLLRQAGERVDVSHRPVELDRRTNSPRQRTTKTVSANEPRRVPSGPSEIAKGSVQLAAGAIKGGGLALRPSQVPFVEFRNARES